MRENWRRRTACLRKEAFFLVPSTRVIVRSGAAILRGMPGRPAPLPMSMSRRSGRRRTAFKRLRDSRIPCRTSASSVRNPTRFALRFHRLSSCRYVRKSSNCWSVMERPSRVIPRRRNFFAASSREEADSLPQKGGLFPRVLHEGNRKVGGGNFERNARKARTTADVDEPKVRPEANCV